MESHEEQQKVKENSGRSVIEKWRNPLKEPNGAIRNDQLYEERPVDVRVDHRSNQSFVRSGEHEEEQVRKSENNGIVVQVRNGENGMIKIKRRQGVGGTIRNIPIKDYQASIVQNFGTLRKSMAPQQQFESLVSEPERNVRLSCSRKKNPGNATSDFRQGINVNQVDAPVIAGDREFAGTGTIRVALGTRQDSRRKSQRRFRGSDGKVATIRNKERTNLPNNVDLADLDEYFQRNLPKRSSINGRRGKRQGKLGSSMNIDNEKNQCGSIITNGRKLTDLEMGHVGQKISVYEKNCRDSKRDRNSRRRQMTLEKKGNCIGVPLIGMHNACGLPIIATWPDEVLGPVPMSRRTSCPVSKVRSAIMTSRSRTHPKRRATRPSSKYLDVFSEDAKRSSIAVVSEEPEVESKGGISKRILRRPSFKATRTNTFPLKRFPGGTIRGGKYDGKRGSSIGTFGRRSLKRRSVKRTTLYARDDGDDAIKVLTNLCLNPLARSKVNMMW